MQSQDAVKCSYVFPGQGSQSVGMGLEIYKASKAAREVFEEADDSLGFPISRLIFNGPEEELQDTVNSQPAIMVVSIACWKAWEEFLGTKKKKKQQGKPSPVSVAGHSLGEYTSLVVVGALPFAEALWLVRERGRLMRQASIEHPGAMAAILGLDEFALEHICAETGVEMANVNTDDQIVISGDRLAVARAMDLASIRGAKKTISLHVSGAFHSSLMSQAREGLAAAVEAVNFYDPHVPVIGNYTGTPLTSADQLRDELLEGLCHCVQWRNSVRYMASAGVTHFVEFGPSKVLSSLIKRIDGDVEAVTLSEPASMEKFAKELR